MPRLLLILLLIAILAPAARAQVAEDDSLALVAFYTATDGPNWTNNTNWLSGPVSTWFGVTVEEDRVTVLILKGNGLSGVIPPEIGNLVNLTFLNLSNTYLMGTIPVTLVNLANLRTFWFDRTDICEPSDPAFQAWFQGISRRGTGCVTADCVGQSEVPQAECEALVALFSGTRGVRNWTKKTNWFTRPISTWYGVTVTEGHVTSVVLNQNQLWGELPTALGNLTYLDSLSLEGYPHTSQVLGGTIPSELGNLTRLTYLNLGANGLSGNIPPELEHLTNLTHLNLSGNCCAPDHFEGEIPAFLSAMTSLTHLDLSWNYLTGAIPSFLDQLTNLTHLNLHFNQLTGVIPSELGNLTTLTVLDLGGNGLTGSIPSGLGNLTNLTYLRLTYNDLTGEIPPELGNLTSLTVLAVGDNELTGTIPSELGNLTNLTDLYLGGNRFTGTIPSELGNLTNLTDLYLSGNQLTGAIPPELGNLANLRYMYLRENQLTGAIPSELGALTNLLILTLNDNPLSGTLPLVLTNLTNLGTFWFHNTDLCEPVDPVFQSWLQGIDDVRSTGCTNVAQEEAANIPADFVLAGNYPNPFHTATTIRYTLPQAVDVELVVYDMMGRKVAVLVRQRQGAGRYEEVFEAFGRASGVYVYVLRAGERSAQRTMLLVR